MGVGMTRRYRMLRLLARMVVGAQMRLRVEHADHVPREGGVLLVSNHLGLTDPLPIGVRLPRQMRMLGKVELFGWFLIGWAARQAGAVSIRRGESDRHALALLSKLLQSGECVLVFPEGTYRYAPESPGMLPFKAGAAWLALRTGVPIVPVALKGTENVWYWSRGWRPWRRMEVTVTFGEPYVPERPQGRTGKAALEAVTAEMAARIAALLPPDYRGFYGQDGVDEAASRVHGERAPAPPDAVP
jgi:1-acyl-sn-glycerol-3-phosphate acyltransferase